MLEEHVDALKDYLRCHKDLAERVRFDPLQVFHRGRWRRVCGIRVSVSGIEVEFSKGGRTRLVPEGRVTRIRMDQRNRLIRLIQRLLGRVRVIRTLTETDRIRVQSAAFLRVVLESRSKRIAVIAAYEGEPVESRARFLVSLVLWWDSLSPSEGISRLIGLVPRSWSSAMVQDVEALRVPIDLYWYQLDDLATHPIESAPQLSEVGPPYVIFPNPPTLPTYLRSLSLRCPELDLLYRKDRWELSYRGLPIVWEASGGGLIFNLFQPQSFQPEDPELFRKHLEQVKRIRCFPPRDPGHVFYTYGRERWFESLLIRKHRILDPNLSDEIYCQVPTWVGGERKVVDLLTITREGRLAVLELKPRKDLTLIFQGLDYWNRVSHHLRQGDFEKAGYFREKKLLPMPPLLYLVSPLFDFHRLLPVFCRHLNPYISFKCFGTNQDWKRGLKLLRRFQFRA